ncbi:MAG: protoporphyrinogen oxidase, partial [Frankiales bacterium]|nr:protoporphyrinogen oxidase [Frankiales bacterium]
MPVIAVIGGGISGLSAARRLAELRPDARVVVLEAAERVGGKLRREQVGGAWVDVGAEAMLARRPEGVAAAAEAGLSAELISPLTTAALIRNRGQNRSLPARTLIGIPSDVAALRASHLLDPQSVARIEQEPAEPGLAPLTEDISVGELVQRRFGPEVVDRLVDPLLGGVYAGHAREISLQAAVPALAQRLDAGGGSLLA